MLLAPCFVWWMKGNYEVIALRLLQRRLHLVALYWHPTISLSISFQLKRPTRPIEECSSLPTACICKLSFPHSFRFRNISYWKQSLFAWCLSITRRPISCGWISAPIARPLPFCSIGLWWFVGVRRPAQRCRSSSTAFRSSVEVPFSVARVSPVISICVDSGRE